MAYGKLKADTLVYDNSGSDVEVTISSLGNKVDAANPTFTGTVTIPTPTAGDNTTKAASTAFVVAGFAPKASPTFTGTVNAAALTLSGNLQVNGTTTTVASSTMTVADKNIELAKGAANDAAADGGGITLESGDGNKEIKWVDSTNSWTFNQTIETTGAIKGNSIITSTGSLGVGTHSITSPNSVNRSIHVHDSAHSSLVLSDDQNTWEVVSNNDLTVRDGTDTRLTINTTGNATFAGTVSDSKGNLRDIPMNYQTSATTLAASDAGKVVAVSSGGWVIPSGVFSAGNTITLLNSSSSNQTINATALNILYNTADGANVKGNTLTLGARSIATIWMGTGTDGYIQASALTVS